MSDANIFQGLNRVWDTGTPPMAWPTTAWKNYFFECPVAVTSHLQRFMMRQAQDQMQVFAELARDPNPTNAITRQSAFAQQAALAWNAEMMELAELVQSKLLSSAAPTAEAEKAPLARAA
ncbi:hypothetical protein V5F38_04735 [Xanthobacter sp. V0B-10]|uniref:hypothetical protein n=1 Tax=Xanthobacter albus TaxID=3119929 RepID=UPI003727B3BF